MKFAFIFMFSSEPLSETSMKSKNNLFKSGGGLKESKRLDVPLLGKIPISIEMMHATDKGEPIILSQPNNSVSNLFRDLVKKINTQLQN